MNEKDILRRHATHAYELTDADRAEIVGAFAIDPAICFSVASSEHRFCRDFFRSVWECNPDALILNDVDICEWRKEPAAQSGQYLIINKGGDKPSTDHILDLLQASGLASDALVCYTPKEGDGKHCFRIVFGSDRPAPVHAVRLYDDGHLLLSVRIFKGSKTPDTQK